MSRNRMALGKAGEKYARRYLEKKGYTIVAANHRTRYGEIDLIARDRGTMVFIEVKTRRSRSFGSGLEAITRDKQRHLSLSAQSYLQQQRLLDVEARFDAVALTLTGTGGFEVEHLQNVFELNAGH